MLTRKILLEKLYSRRDKVLCFIESYLKDRTLLTQMRQVDLRSKAEVIYSSRGKLVKYGVLQGSVMGPLLFICVQIKSK